jgi:hypothetical protein
MYVDIPAAGEFTVNPAGEFLTVNDVYEKDRLIPNY